MAPKRENRAKDNIIKTVAGPVNTRVQQWSPVVHCYDPCPATDIPEQYLLTNDAY